MEHIYNLAKRAKEASYKLAKVGTAEKNRALMAMSQALLTKTQDILHANAMDLNNGRNKGMSVSLLDRLMLDEKRIADMAQGVADVAKLNDPIGETISGWKRENGLNIQKRRVPLGVVGIIYEARPNVTSDAVSLCLKTSNACVLRGGSEAIHTNQKIVEVLRYALEQTSLPPDSCVLIEDTTHEGANAMMKLNGLIDVLIPRGGAKLIAAVVSNATIPVIETGVGNCHVYMDVSGDINKGLDILYNAKTQRVSVCNACESLLVHKDIASTFLPLVYEKLSEKNVEFRGCEQTAKILGDCVRPATEVDFATEFCDYIISVKVVDCVDDAIDHINQYGTKHSETIITNDFLCAQRFFNEVDSACVYVNASTRFTDGFEFGFGAEIGISTQKLHARGPMGLNELTSYKYIIEGDGQVR